MYRWNRPNKFVQTNLNMRYLDLRDNKLFKRPGVARVMIITTEESWGH